jgi:hypothetical protein
MEQAVDDQWEKWFRNDVGIHRAVSVDNWPTRGVGECDTDRPGLKETPESGKVAGIDNADGKLRSDTCVIRHGCGERLPLRRDASNGTCVSLTKTGGRNSHPTKIDRAFGQVRRSRSVSSCSWSEPN